MSGALCLDLTRTISRAGRVPTGVDRVELAYLREFLTRDGVVLGLVRTALGFVVLNRVGMQDVLDRTIADEWGRPDWAGHLSRKLNRTQAAAQSTVRANAVARASSFRLAAMLRKILPDGTDYYNVGLSNLAHSTLAALPPSVRISILIHDTIPLDFPQYQRIGSPAAFAEKMQAIIGHADRIICNSPQTKDDVIRHMPELDQPPLTVVAELGLDPVGPEEAVEVPSKPFFITLGTIEPRKNHIFLLDLWAQMKNPPELLIVGARGWRNDTVFARLDKKPPHVTELSGLRDGQVLRLLHRARGLLFPSHAEGYGLPALEAARLGVPVICNDLPVFRHLLGNIPVYARVSESYEWENAIRTLAESSPAPKGPPYDPPTWDTHFNTVLTTSW